MKQIRHYLVLVILLTAFMANAQTITSVSLSPAGPYCPGAGVSVTFVINTTGGNFKPSNTFTAELSSSAGSFASPVVIGTLKTTAAGTINATLPAAPAAGTSYVIRVISSNPASTGASSSAFEIKATCGGGGGGTSLDNLTDVTITTPATGQLLKYDGSAWVNSAAAIGDITGLQTALDAKLAKNSVITGASKTKVTYDDNGLVTAGADAGIADITGLQTALDAKLAKNSVITGATKTKVSYDANGLVTAGADAGIADIDGLQTALDAKLANTAGLSNLSGVSISSPSNNQVLTYNGTNWVNANASGGGGSGWSLTGNSGLSGTTNFIGTIDDVPLVLKQNNVVVGKIVGNFKYNVSFGHNSSANTTTGDENVSLGKNSLYTNTTGAKNIAVGREAQYSNLDGYWNVAVGTRSLAKMGIQSLSGFLQGSGIANTAIGHYAMEDLETGYANTAIGQYTSVGLNSNNATAIGGGAVASASNNVRIGNSSVEVIEGQVDFSVVSDGRYKKNVKEDAPGLNLIMKLRPVTYNFEYSKFSEHLNEKKADKAHLQQRESKKEMGFVAQEVEKALKEAGTAVNNLVNVPQSAAGHYSLAYSELVVPLVKAVQEQQKIIEELKKAVEVLQKQTPTAKIDGKTAKATVLEMPETSTLLGQNIPNPFNTNTIIPFRLPANCNSAAIVITNITTGKSIRAIPVSSSETQLSLDASKLPSGNYAYSLYIDGKVVDTKKMMMVR